MSKLFILTGSMLGALSVIIGAFGAHALKTILEAHQRIETFETAVKYQFYHALALVLLGIIMMKVENKWMIYSGYGYIAGIVIFSGSLYILSLTGTNSWGAITPFGGLIFILAWLFLFTGVSKGL